MSAERRATCCHEAAHTVVGAALGYRVRLVVVKDGLRISGFTEHDPRTDLSALESAANDVTILTAGRIGEYLALATGYGEWVDNADDEAAIAARIHAALGALPPDEAAFISYVTTDPRPRDTDADRAEAIAASAAGRERALFLEFCRSRAERLVWENAPAIHALAAELLRRPALDGPTAEDVIHRARQAERE